MWRASKFSRRNLLNFLWKFHRIFMVFPLKILFKFQEKFYGAHKSNSFNFQEEFCWITQKAVGLLRDSVKFPKETMWISEENSAEIMENKYKFKIIFKRNYFKFVIVILSNLCWQLCLIYERNSDDFSRIFLSNISRNSAVFW